MRHVFGKGIGLALMVLAAGCATYEPVPIKRPMSAENAQIAGQTEAILRDQPMGVGKAWFYTSSAGAGAAYGLAGAIASAIVDAIVNAGPSARATRAADEVATGISIDEINAHMLQELREEVRTEVTGGGPVTLTGVTNETMSARRIAQIGIQGTQGKLVIMTDYLLSEDASTLRVTATASYTDAATPWRTPYVFQRQVPREQLTGPAYFNRFTYYSDAIKVPPFSPEFKQQLVAAVEAAARDANGNLPAEGTREYNSYQRELTRANDDEFSKDEIALFLVIEWTKDNGQLLRRHITAAHEFFATYIIRDINDPTVPSLTGVDERIETLPDERTVRRIGSGLEAGAYVSSPPSVAGFVTFGNTANFSADAQERNRRLEEAERPQRGGNNRNRN